jgi:hypothetical protein
MTNYAERKPWPDAACIGRLELMTMPYLDRPVGKAGGVTYTREQRAQVKRAKYLCVTCPRLEECRAWALTDPDPCNGMVAGAMTPAERNKARAS